MSRHHRLGIRILATLLALAGASLAVVEGCRPGPELPSAASPPVAATTPLPPYLSPPPAPPASSAAALVEPLPKAAAALEGGATFDPSSIVAVVDDARLTEVKAALGRGAYKRAADKLEEQIGRLTPDASDDALWSYQLGLLRRLAGDPLAAVQAFDRAAAADWALSDYARCMAGELLVQVAEEQGNAGVTQASEAIVRLGTIKPGSAIDDEVALWRARALAAARDVDAAAPIWRRHLAQDPKPDGWHHIALRFARALLEQPSPARAKEAVAVARSVIYGAPLGQGVGEARELEKQALSTISTEERSRLSSPALGDLRDRARALADALQGREAVAAADQLISRLKDEAPSDVACEAFLARGKGLATLRRYAESTDAYGLAIERCQGHPRRVYALFLGAQSALRGGQVAEARRRYAQLEKEFPTHSFADDARLHGAEAALSLGDVAAFTTMLGRIAEDYPQGDMVDQALFTLAQARIDASDWAGAVAPLSQAIALRQRGRPYYAEGRPHYFLARAKLQLGQEAEGRALLGEVIRRFPLSYYMVLAYGRLAARDAVEAERILGEAVGAEPEGDFVIPDHPELHRLEFLRAIELVRQGEGKLALAELDRLGVRDQQAHPSLLWAAAFLLARIDAPAESHGVLRSAADSWQQHYPSGIWRAVWDVAYPRPYHKVVSDAATRFGVPEALAYAVIREESAFNPKAVSSASAYGLMQLIAPTARAMAKPLGMKKIDAAALKQPEVNVPLGCRYLSVLLGKFPYNPLLAIPGYNAGPGAPAKWVQQRPADDFDLFVERIPYRETRRYTKRVIQSLAAYAALYGNGMATPLLRPALKVKPDHDKDKGKDKGKG